MAQMRERMFAKLDGDGDDQIDLAQLQARAEEAGDSVHFSRMLEDLRAADTDGDGMVSREEFEAMEPPEPPPGPPPESGEGMMPPMVDEMSASSASITELLYTADGETDSSAGLSGAVLDLLG